MDALINYYAYFCLLLADYFYQLLLIEVQEVHTTLPDPHPPPVDITVGLLLQPAYPQTDIQ